MHPDRWKLYWKTTFRMASGKPLSCFRRNGAACGAKFLVVSIKIKEGKRKVKTLSKRTPGRNFLAKKLLKMKKGSDKKWTNKKRLLQKFNHLRSFWILLGPFWGRFGVILRSFCCRFGIFSVFRQKRESFWGVLDKKCGGEPWTRFWRRHLGLSIGKETRPKRHE